MPHVVAADVAVVPVEHVDGAIRPDLEAESNPVRVVRHQDVLTVARSETGPLAREHVGQHGVLVDVGHEHPALLRRRKRVRLVDARAAVRRAMAMVGDGLNVAVDVRVEVLAALAMVDPARHHVEQVRDDARADEQLSLRVVVDAPRIAEAVGDDLEDVFRRVIPPDAAVDLDPVALQQIVGERLLRLEQPATTGRFPHASTSSRTPGGRRASHPGPSAGCSALRDDPGCPNPSDAPRCWRRPPCRRDPDPARTAGSAARRRTRRRTQSRARTERRCPP